MLDDPDLDVVYIPLPNSLHAEWTVRALQAGKHVLCEKPLALTIEDVDRIEAAARRAERVAVEGFMYRHQALTRTVEAIVRSGRLGRVRGYKGAFSFPLTREGDVRFDPALGGGSLWDVGCYPLGYSNMLAGASPVEVFGWQQTSDTGIDLEFSAMMRYANGSVAQFDSGFIGPFRAEMEVVGTDGTLRVARPFRTDDRTGAVLTSGDTVEQVSFPIETPFAGEIADMESAVLEGRPPGVPLSESRRTVQTILALYRSATERRPISL